ncbi:hypothetical protein BJX68DRAFT_242206 [Aspergillus pseudodeflectus]|uniref:Uncharacterized protein n=1 Tax=Aspergillus pseudodeflectus TaxID=176178 RepID=A0ABR4JZ60_9EURO
MASARLRKAFRYPDDSGDDDAREELDEEEQERVIKHLQQQNDKRNSEYTLIFSAIPLLSTIVFLPSLSSSASLGVATRFYSLLGIASLVATAYTMKYIPPMHPDPKGKRPIRNPDLTAHIRQYLIPANSAVCALLGLAYLFSSGTAAPVMQPTAYLVPAALLSIILLVRQVMVSVDLAPLGELRYEYKGA